jgi:hypothetical protein
MSSERPTVIPGLSTTDDLSGKACRLCSSLLSGDQRLALGNAPAGAQLFLDSPTAGDRRDVVTLHIVQCPSCGLVQSASPPVKYYRSVITAAGVSPAMRAHRQKQVAEFSAAYGLTGRSVIEIGCGNGYFLDILAEAGLKAHGTEWGGPPGGAGSHPVADTYPAPGIVIPGAPFDAFFCLNFLEHAPDPRSFLGGICENLAKDAVGIVEVPNYTQQRRLRRVFDYIADHVSYFDSDTISTTLALSGLVVEKISETRGGENLEVWVRCRIPSDLVSEANSIAEVQAMLVSWLAFRRAAGERVAIWGASHQALTLLGPVNPSDLVGIFDSAPFKQGRYAPVTRLPILKPSPEAFRDIDCVLLVASGYEREIATTLRNTMRFRGGVFFIQGDIICHMEA